MSTTLKGDKFKKRVFDFMSREIREDRFYARPELCKIFMEKGYYSRDRKSEIKFDVSIEIFRPEQKDPSIIVFIECKDYSHPIPVDDAEEFYAKLQQVAGANVKGIFASTAPFQSGALEYAKSKKFGFLRYFDSDEFLWELNRAPSSYWSNKSYDRDNLIYRGLVTKNFRSSYFDCYFSIAGNYTNSLFEAIELLVLLDTSLDTSEITSIRREGGNPDPSVPFIEKKEIEAIAKNILSTVVYTDGSVQLEKICKLFEKDDGLVIEHEHAPENYKDALGSVSFKDKKITLYTHTETNEHRVRFTLAHELGHYSLGHGKYMRGETIGEDELNGYDKDRTWLLNEDIRRLEWQANYFASNLLMPEAQVLESFFGEVIKLQVQDRGFGMLYVDDQPENLRNYFDITREIMREFKVSREAVTIRLKQLGYLNDARNKHFRHVLQFELLQSDF